MALAVVLADEAVADEPAEHPVPPLLPRRLEGHRPRRRARHVDLKRCRQRKRRVRHRAGKVEEKGLGRRGVAGGGAPDEGDRLRGHPLRVVRALRRLLVAAPHRGRLLEAAILPHDLRDLLVAEAAPRAAKLGAAAAWRRRTCQRASAAESRGGTCRRSTSRSPRALQPVRDGRLVAGEEGVEADHVPRAVRWGWSSRWRRIGR